MPNRVVFPVAALKKFRQTMEARMHLTGEPIDDFKTVYDRFAQAYNLGHRPGRLQLEMDAGRRSL